MLSRLVYYSERDRACDDAQVEEILARAAPRNLARDVTGLLIAGRSNFIQILEGPRTAVSLLFQDISRDPRHNNIVLAEVSEIEGRSYPRWGLGFLSDPGKIEAAWARVCRNQIWEPSPLNALQLRGLLRIAMGDARREPGPALAVA